MHALAGRIIRGFDEKGLTVAAQKATGFDMGDFSRIRNADVSRFTLDRLIRIYTALDADTEVVLKLTPRVMPTSKSAPGRARVGQTP